MFGLHLGELGSVGETVEPPEPEIITADSATITADSNTVTADGGA